MNSSVIKFSLKCFLKVFESLDLISCLGRAIAKFHVVDVADCEVLEEDIEYQLPKH